MQDFGPRGGGVDCRVSDGRPTYASLIEGGLSLPLPPVASSMCVPGITPLKILIRLSWAPRRFHDENARDTRQKLPPVLQRGRGRHFGIFLPSKLSKYDVFNPNQKWPEWSLNGGQSSFKSFNLKTF